VQAAPDAAADEAVRVSVQAAQDAAADAEVPGAVRDAAVVPDAAVDAEVPVSAQAAPDAAVDAVVLVWEVPDAEIRLHLHRHHRQVDGSPLLLRLPDVRRLIPDEEKAVKLNWFCYRLLS
jgi:hypothetical protein